MQQGYDSPCSRPASGGWWACPAGHPAEVRPMIAFLIETENRVGSAAEVAETISERGINITGGSGLAVGSSGRLALTTNDEAGTRRALLGRGYKFREIEIVPITLPD